MKDTLGQSHARHVLLALASARASQPLVALVGGPPASGKSTVAEALGRLTGLVTLHKDAFKEPLMSELGVSSVEQSVAHSRVAVVSLFAAADAVAASGRGVILDSTFSARDVERISRLRSTRGCALLQVHVSAATDVLMRRWAERSHSRHPGHLDTARAAELRARIEAKTWEPLPINAPLLRIDTTAGELFYARDVARRDQPGGGADGNQTLTVVPPPSALQMAASPPIDRASP